MLPIYIGVYIFILATLWWFFFIARHHSYKFKHFSTHIGPVTFLLMLFLAFLSVIGFFAIFSLWENTNTIRIDTTEKIQNSYY